MHRLLLACFAIASLANSTWAAEPDENTFTDPTKAGPDYKDQGEYLGEFGEEIWGAQLIALGGGNFASVAYAGGLPGQGWSRGDSLVRGTGARDGDHVLLRGEVDDKSWVAVVKDGTITVKNNDGEVVGRLKRVVRKSKTLGAKPPQDATVLFDGSTADGFDNGKIVQENLLLADCSSKLKLQDHVLHLEFRTPFKPYARGQGRGNSGMYVQSRYEVQVLDSFGLDGKNNECGGIYSISEPAVNMCYPPLQWQTYDYEFTAARYKDGDKVKNARVTIRHNGVVIHEDLELPNHTPGRQAEGPEAAPLYLQGHGNPVVYRNIWVVEK